MFLQPLFNALGNTGICPAFSLTQENVEVMHVSLMDEYGGSVTLSCKVTRSRHNTQAKRVWLGYYGGEGGIRTHGRVTPTAVFETARFGRSRTSPFCRCSAGWPIASAIASEVKERAELTLAIDVLQWLHTSLLIFICRHDEKK